jgi:regulator of replication initiation timing
MASDLIKKSQDIQSQLLETYSDQLTADFEKDLELYHEFINKINIYERVTLNTLSDQKETIEIFDFIKLLKERLNKGMARQVSEISIKLVEDVCEWSNMKLRPVLQEQTHKLEEIHKEQKKVIKQLFQEKEELIELLISANDFINETDNFKNEITDLKLTIKRLTDYILQLESGKTKEMIKETEFVDKIVKCLSNLPDTDKTEVIEASTEPKTSQKEFPAQINIVKKETIKKPRVSIDFEQ